MGGISNGQIEKAFRDLGDPDLLDNFVGVFPSDYLNKFVNHAAMCKVKFNLGTCKDLTEDEIMSLSDTARQFFLFCSKLW